MTHEQLTGRNSDHLTSVVLGSKSFIVSFDVAASLLDLTVAANKAGFQLEVASGYRDFDRQSQIWNKKYSGLVPILDSLGQPIDIDSLSNIEKIHAILRWAALPGASRHHWGTDFDIYARNCLPNGIQLQLEPWEYISGHQGEFYQWMKSELDHFGFFTPYFEDLGGVAPEPWHISHISSSAECLKLLTPEVILEALNSSSIHGLPIISDNIHTIYQQYVSNITRINHNE